MNEKKAVAFVDFARQVADEEAVWADWQNRVFGVNGKFMELFPTEAEREEFSESGLYAEIEKISDGLRQGKTIKEYTIPDTTAAGVTSASGRFVVRIPKSLHQALTAQAVAEGVSLNQLVVYKLSLTLKMAAQDLLEKSKQNEFDYCENK